MGHGVRRHVSKDFNLISNNIFSKSSKTQVAFPLSVVSSYNSPLSSVDILLLVIYLTSAL